MARSPGRTTKSDGYDWMHVFEPETAVPTSRNPLSPGFKWDNLWGDLQRLACMRQRKQQSSALPGGALPVNRPFSASFDWNGPPAPGKSARKGGVMHGESHRESVHWGYDLAVALLVLVSVSVGNWVAFGKHEGDELASFNGSYGQATLVATLVFAAVILGPMASPRVELVFFAAAPTAYVWLLPALSQLGFANNLPSLRENNEADLLGLIANPQASRRDSNLGHRAGSKSAEAAAQSSRSAGHRCHVRSLLDAAARAAAWHHAPRARLPLGADGRALLRVAPRGDEVSRAGPLQLPRHLQVCRRWLGRRVGQLPRTPVTSDTRGWRFRPQLTGKH